ncbi:Fe-S oxidoreductase, partial [Thiovulum sp. ES]
DTVDHLSKTNISYFETFISEVEAIIIPEATCSAMIRVDYKHYFHDQPEWKKRVEKLENKIFLATEWLYQKTDLIEVLERNGKRELSKITYHDPCHSRKMQGVWKEPRKLLEGSFQIAEMSDSNACCGFGGVTMQTEKFHFAKTIGDQKSNMIEETGAEYVSAECSACRVQITDSLDRNSVKTVFKNPIELIAKALNS